MSFFEEGVYFEAADIANELALTVSKYYDKDIKDVKCYDIQSYTEEVEGVYIDTYRHRKQLNKIMIGATHHLLGNTIIVINNNLMPERKNFTLMHEIMHVYCDADSLRKGQIFSDMLIEDGYFQEDLPIELRANIGASVLLANSSALKSAVNRFTYFNELAQFFFMSKSALFNRLTQYLMFEYNCTSDYATKIVNQYKYNDNKLILSILNKK